MKHLALLLAILFTTALLSARSVYSATPTPTPSLCNADSVPECQGKASGEFCGSGESQGTCKYSYTYLPTPYPSGFVPTEDCVCDFTLSPTPTPTPTESPTPTPTSTGTPSPTPSYPTPSNTPTPTPTPPQYAENGKKCGGGKSIYPPNSDCYSSPKLFQPNMEDYPLSCIPEPQITYSKDYIGGTPPTSVLVDVLTNLAEARLGGFGPDAPSISSQNPDMLAQNYLYSGLFDKPNFTRDYTPREAYRAYWRLLSQRDQANLKSIALNKIHKGEYKNTKYKFIDKNGKTWDTDAKDLYNKLNIQFSIVQFIPPIIERNCLVQLPVCQYHTRAYLDLPNFLADGDLKSKYDAFIPFDWDDLRAYIVSKKGDVSKESIPYLNAILNGLEGEYGITPVFSPSWMYKPQAKFSATDYEPPVIKKAAKVGEGMGMCSPPPKSSNLQAPKTWPNDPSAVTQQVLITNLQVTSDTTEEPMSPTDTCPDGEIVIKGGYNYCSTTTHHVTGSGVGTALGVLNNPKVKSITKSVVGEEGAEKQGFVSMMTPNFAKLPEKAMIDAPTSNHTTTTDGASVSNPSNPIYRENNLAQDAMHELQNCWAMPSHMQTSPKCAPFLNSATTSGDINCRQNLPPQSDKCVFPKEVVHDVAKRWLGNRGHDFVMECYDDVIATAKENGIDPAFAMWIWVHESGASNYSAFPYKIQDFGVNDKSIENDFTAQITRFMPLAKNYPYGFPWCFNNGYPKFLNFLQIYYKGATYGGPCIPTTDGAYAYYNEILVSWNWVSPCPMSTSYYPTR